MLWVSGDIQIKHTFTFPPMASLSYRQRGQYTHRFGDVKGEKEHREASGVSP